MRFAVIGVGGVGGYFGGRLAHAGEDVVFIARGEQLAALKNSGLRVDSINGDFAVRAVNATNDPSKAGTVDVIILGVKAWQVTEASKSALPMAGPNTYILPLQNGVEATDEAAAVFGSERVLAGLCRISSFIAGPGHIKHTALEGMIAFNERNGQSSARVEELRKTLEGAGIKVDVPSNIDAALWTKFLFIAPLGGVGAVARAPIGITRQLPQTRELLLGALVEIQSVARARGVALSETAAHDMLATLDQLPSEAASSMHRDIVAGRPSELEYQNGAVVRIGRQCDVATPVNEFLYSSLLPQEMRARGTLSFS